MIISYLQEYGIPYQINNDLAKTTWLRRGGIASLMIFPGDCKQLEVICRYLYSKNIDFELFGHTSNLYIHNSYSPHIVVSTKKCKRFVELNEYIYCEAGASVATIAKYYVNNGYSGMEYLTNLPGTLGGAIYNNSSCKRSIVSDLLLEADVLLEDGTLKVWNYDDFHFSFRKSILKEKYIKGIILSIKLKKRLGNSIELKTISINNENERRANIQNPSKTLGSTFSSQYDNGNMPSRYRIPWAIFNVIIKCLVKDVSKQKELSKSFLLSITGYKDLKPYISNNTFIMYQWIDNQADTKFPRYEKFMNSIMKTTNLEIEQKKGREETVNLLTIHWGYSFGAVLQTYATCKILSSFGKKVNVINLLNHDADFDYKQWRSYFNLINIYKFYNFKRIYFPNLTKKMYFIDTHKIPKAEYTVVGSDQVWNKTITKENSLSFFLDFTNNVKFSFSSSFGVDEWIENNQYTEVVKKNLSQFSHVSVRESTAKTICEKYFDIQSEQIIDPTLIWGRFDDLITKKAPIDQIFPFFLHRSIEKDQIVSYIAKQTNLSVFRYNMFTLRLFRGPLDWLSRMYNSKFIVTDSFHGVAFSILFRKNFIVLCSEPQKFTRISSLLELTNLKGRYVQSYEDLISRWEILSKSINFDYAYTILEKQRNKAKIYLNKVFNGLNNETTSQQ